MLKFKTKSRAVLHVSGCMHIADYSDPAVSLTLKRKVCAPCEKLLRVWAEERGLQLTTYRTCIG